MRWQATVIALAVVAAVPVRALPANEQRDDTFEYIVVGSGAGGGPLASRLARAGKRTLLIEAGDDQSDNVNTTVPIFQTLVTGDPQIRWDFFVNHYQDQARAQTDPKYSYDIGNGELYTGLTPPPGAQPKGILYPRAQTLGGCMTHNALIWITPQDSDWNHIADITGDDSWTASNMAKYLDRVYEWQPIGNTDPTILVRDLQLVQQLGGGASVISPKILGYPNPIQGLLSALLADPNARIPGRDSATGFFGIPLQQFNGQRIGVREFIKATVAEGFPLTVWTDTLVTKINFDTSGPTPSATGVEYLSGGHLYRASPLSGDAGIPGSVTATEEVILSGGTYNSVQLLKLSGIGPREELESFDIPVLVESPGVGQNMQDRYEIGLNVQHDRNFPILDGCTLDAKLHDLCFYQWLSNVEVLAARGAYATDGLAAAMIDRSAQADSSNFDMFTFASPSNFTGYFPGWWDTVLANHNTFSWYTLKAHARNTAGTVALRSADPLDPPIINFNYFDTGTTTDGADKKDLAALVDAIKKSRQALQYYNTLPLLRLLGGSPFKEVYPGPLVQSDEDIGTYIKNRAWGHHASCTNSIGALGDPNAVLDSKFRVQGTNNLRVVDASIFPKIPGTFITSSIVIASEKAADTILYG